MFATIAKFNKENISSMSTIPVERKVETSETESRSVPIQSGGW
jgi:hypothetical protein